MRRLAWAAFLVGCGTDGGDIVGPFHGAVHRYVVDDITVPLTSADAAAAADDLDGSGPKNQLGGVTGSIHSLGDLTTHGLDMIRGGAITSSVEIQTDDLISGTRVGVTYRGSDGAAATVMGGKLVDGALQSNRSRTTTHPGMATIVLPLLNDADPIAVELDVMEIDLAPDGNGGYDALVRGGIKDAITAAATDIAQMIASRPYDHFTFTQMILQSKDGTFTVDQIANSNVVDLLVRNDIVMDTLLSAGFHVHLSPCDTGSCSAAPPADLCRDRVLDQDESDTDCGGTKCMSCEGGFACRGPSDCASGACDAGHCRAPTCSDGHRDGFEADVDCAGFCPTKCGAGKACRDSGDCISSNCSGVTHTCQ